MTGLSSFLFVLPDQMSLTRETLTAIGKKTYRPSEKALEEMYARFRLHGVHSPNIKLCDSVITGSDGSTAHVIAPCPLSRSGKKKTSKASSDALDYLAKLNGSPIWHGGNGDEVQVHVGGKVYNVDGYMPAELTVFEFNGDAFHPNLLQLPVGAVWKVVSSGKPGSLVRAGGYFDKQLAKVTELEMAGFRVVTLSEIEWSKKARELTRIAKGKKKAKEIAIVDGTPLKIVREKGPLNRKATFRELAMVGGTLEISSFVDIGEQMGRPASSTSSSSSSSTLSALNPYRRPVKPPTYAGRLESAKKPDVPLEKLLSTGPGRKEFYGVACGEKYAEVCVGAAYYGLRDVHREATLRKGLSRICSEAADELLPFSYVEEGERALTKTDYAMAHLIACTLLEKIAPALLDCSPPLSSTVLLEKSVADELLPTFLEQYVVEESESFKRIFGKRGATSGWDEQKARAFVNVILKRVYGIKLRAVKSHYSIGPSPLFELKGGKLRPVEESE